MASESNVELSLGQIWDNSVEIYASNQFASETGEIVISDYHGYEVARSQPITVYQNTVSVIIGELTKGTFYDAYFESETTGGESDFIHFYTLASNRIYGSANSASAMIREIYGSVSNQATELTKLYGSVNGKAKLIHQSFGHLDYT